MQISDYKSGYINKYHSYGSNHSQNKLPCKFFQVKHIVGYTFVVRIHGKEPVQISDYKGVG